MSWLSLLFARRPAPAARELIHFQCNGCMGEDWVEVDRGIIVGRTKRVIHGSPNDQTYLVVERPDGSRFECWRPDCMPATDTMSARLRIHTPLAGRWVFLT